MYVSFLRRIVALLQSVNAANKDSDIGGGSEVYTNDIPVLYDGDLAGFLRDEIGGDYNYVPATEKDQEWWALRPWAPKKPINSNA